MRQLWLLALAVCMTTGVARAQGPATQPNFQLPRPVTQHSVTMLVTGVFALNGGSTGGGMLGLCYERETKRSLFEMCQTFSADNHLTFTTETTFAMFWNSKYVALGGGLVFMAE